MSLDQEAKILAGSYVLGLLEPEEKAATERRMRVDPEFFNAVERFAANMQVLDETVTPQPVPNALWEKIEANLDKSPGPGQKPADNIIEFSKYWRDWQKAAIAASLLFALGLGFAGGWFMRPSPEPVVLVVLDTENNAPGAVFEAFADNSVRIIPLQDFEVPEGKILQVWTL